jgi:hypothetical protein
MDGAVVAIAAYPSSIPECALRDWVFPVQPVTRMRSRNPPFHQALVRVYQGHPMGRALHDRLRDRLIEMWPHVTASPANSR